MTVRLTITILEEIPFNFQIQKILAVETKMLMMIWMKVHSQISSTRILSMDLLQMDSIQILLADQVQTHFPMDLFQAILEVLVQMDSVQIMLKVEVQIHFLMDSIQIMLEVPVQMDSIPIRLEVQVQMESVPVQMGVPVLTPFLVDLVQIMLELLVQTPIHFPICSTQTLMVDQEIQILLLEILEAEMSNSREGQVSKDPQNPI